MAPVFKRGPFRGGKIPGRLPWSVTRGLTGRWPLDSASCEFNTAGNQVRPLDIVGNNFGVDAKSRMAVDPGGLPPGLQGSGSAYHFDETSSSYIILNADPFASNGGPVGNSTLSIWVYNAGASQASTIWGFTNLFYVLIDDGTNALGPANSIQVESAGGLHTTAAAAPLNRWTHVAITTSGGVPSAIYINGVSVSTATGIAGFGTPPSNFIGARGTAGSRTLKGSLADARVYCNTVLTVAEINELYQSAFTTELFGVEDEWPQLPYVAPTGNTLFGRLSGLRTIGPRLQTPLPELQQDLTLWVPFHDVQSANPHASDLGRFNKSVTKSGSAGFDPALYHDGTVGGGSLFNGTSGATVAGFASNNFLTVSGWSASLWVKATGSPPTNSPDTYSGHQLVGDAGGFYGLYRDQIGVGNDLWAAYNWDGSDDRVTTPCITNVWTHLVAVVNGSTLSFYKDGALIGATASGNTTDLNADTRIGAQGFTGSIGDVRLYKRALIAGEVLALYQNPFTAELYRSQEPWGGPGAPPSGAPSGTLAATEAADTAALTGTFAGGASGTLAATEATDVAALTGTVSVSGILAATEATDVAAIIGFQGASGILAATEATDVASIVGTAGGASGTLAATEAADIAAITGNIAGATSGTLAAVETADTAAFVGTAGGASGTLAATEAADTAALTGTFAVPSGVLAAVETTDVAALTGTVVSVAIGTLVTIEAPDTCHLVGTFTPPAGVPAESPYPSPYDYGWYKGKPLYGRGRRGTG